MTIYFFLTDYKPENTALQPPALFIIPSATHSNNPERRICVQSITLSFTIRTIKITTVVKMNMKIAIAYTGDNQLLESGILNLKISTSRNDINHIHANLFHRE